MAQAQRAAQAQRLQSVQKTVAVGRGPRAPKRRRSEAPPVFGASCIGASGSKIRVEG